MLLRVYAKKIETNDGKASFIGMTLVGKKTNVKFTQDCQADMDAKLPKENGYYLIDVESDALSLAKPKKDAKSDYSTLWVRDGFKVHSIKRDEEFEAKKALERATAIANLEADDIHKDEAENIFGK